jgi:prepilin-type N-terminal cleavage/methylation domain-containing protein
MRARAPHKAGVHAFTLIELVVVVALLAVLTGMVVPMFGASLRGIQQKGTRNDFVSLIAFLQARAVVESREYRLYMREKEGEFWAARHTAMDGEDKVFEPVEEDFGKLEKLPPRVEFDVSKAPRDSRQKANYIGFYPNGACDRALITLRDPRDAKKVFSIKTTGALGRVEVKEL